MSSLRAKIFDRNRYAKRYPLIRAPKRMTYRGDTELAIEVGSIYFDNASEGTLVFDFAFNDSGYQAIALARDSTGSESADVNLYIDSLNSNEKEIIIKSSAPFTGYVDILAVRVGS